MEDNKELIRWESSVYGGEFNEFTGVATVHLVAYDVKVLSYHVDIQPPFVDDMDLLFKVDGVKHRYRFSRREVARILSFIYEKLGGVLEAETKLITSYGIMSIRLSGLIFTLEYDGWVMEIERK